MCSVWDLPEQPQISFGEVYLVKPTQILHINIINHIMISKAVLECDD